MSRKPAPHPAVLLAVFLVHKAAAATCLEGSVCVVMPPVALGGFTASLVLQLPSLQPSSDGSLQPWPMYCDALVFMRHADYNGAVLQSNVTVALYANDTNVGHVLHDVQLTAGPMNSGRVELEVVLLPAGTTVDDGVRCGGSSSLPLWRGGCGGELSVWTVPAWLSLLPPLLTVVIAVATRQVLLALLAGIYSGGVLVHKANPMVGALRLLDTMLPASIGGGSHPLILTFTLLLGGMISILRHSGGSAGLARIAAAVTKRPSQVLLSSAGLATLVGLDDYASILIAGSAMQPVGVAFGVPALQLAWVLHGIGVCIPSIHPLSSWMGVQLGYVSQMVALLPGLSERTSPLLLLLSTTPTRFFPVLYICFTIYMLAIGTPDFGRMRTALASAPCTPPPQTSTTTPTTPMDMQPAMAAHVDGAAPLPPPTSRLAEREDGCINATPCAREPTASSTCPAATNLASPADPSDRPQTHASPTNPADPPTADTPTAAAATADDPPPPPRALFALLPLSAMMIATPVGMGIDGSAKAPGGSLIDAFAASNSTAALTWATGLGNLLAILMPLCAGQRIGGLINAWVEGVREVSEAMVILLLAWALGAVVSDLHTADYLSSLLGSWLPASLLPAVSLLLSMAISFGVGSAWGSMGILIPLVAPLAWKLSDSNLNTLTECLGAVMGGAVFGNVCSPLGDTAVLSAMICRCDMMDHVTSQATYVGLVAGLSLLLSLLISPLSVWVCLCLGLLALAASPFIARALRTQSAEGASITQSLWRLVHPATRTRVSDVATAQGMAPLLISPPSGVHSRTGAHGE